MADKSNTVIDTIEKQLISNLINIQALSDEFVIDIKYATENNFTGKKIYTAPFCCMQMSTAKKLIAANKELLKRGMRIKIWDAYRPLSAQKLLWEITPIVGFVANPYEGGSIHNCGFAVDVTLVDMNGRGIEMPSEYDDFSCRASRKSNVMTIAASENLSILTGVMVKHGFRTIDTEWWHYDDEDLKERIPLDIPFEMVRGYSVCEGLKGQI